MGRQLLLLDAFVAWLWLWTGCRSGKCDVVVVAVVMFVVVMVVMVLLLWPHSSAVTDILVLEGASSGVLPHLLLSRQLTRQCLSILSPGSRR